MVDRKLDQLKLEADSSLSDEDQVDEHLDFADDTEEVKADDSLQSIELYSQNNAYDNDKNNLDL